MYLLLNCMFQNSVHQFGASVYKHNFKYVLWNLLVYKINVEEKLFFIKKHKNTAITTIFIPFFVKNLNTFWWKNKCSLFTWTTSIYIILIETSQWDIWKVPFNAIITVIDKLSKILFKIRLYYYFCSDWSLNNKLWCVGLI